MEVPPPVPPPAPKKRPLWQLIAAGVAGLFVLCCLGSVVLSAIGRSVETSGAGVERVFATVESGLVVGGMTAQPVTGQVVTALPVEEATEAPAATAAPTEMPEPEPTATQPPEPTAPPTVGSRVEAGDQALTVMEVSRTAELGQFFKASAGKVYVVADVLIEATGDKAAYNLFYFKVKDGEGREYTPTIGADTALQSGELVAGDKVRGNVAFEVPEDATGLVLTYKPVILFDDRDAIRIALPDA